MTCEPCLKKWMGVCPGGKEPREGISGKGLSRRQTAGAGRDLHVQHTMSCSSSNPIFTRQPPLHTFLDSTSFSKLTNHHALKIYWQVSQYLLSILSMAFNKYSINILKLNELMDLLWRFFSELVEFWQLYTHLNCKDDLRWLDPKFTWILPAQVSGLYLLLRFSGMTLPLGTWLFRILWLWVHNMKIIFSQTHFPKK